MRYANLAHGHLRPRPETLVELSLTQTSDRRDAECSRQHNGKPKDRERSSPEATGTSRLKSGGADGTRMSADGDYSDTFRTKTKLSDEKNTPARVVEEVPQRSQTSAMRLDGRKGEKDPADGIAQALDEARKLWLRGKDVSELRTCLYRLMLRLEKD